MLSGIDTAALERELTTVAGTEVRITAASQLNASSRAAPWRIDVGTGGQSASYLLRHGDACSANEVAALHAMENHSIPTPRVLVWDPSGESLGTPVFVSEWIEGEPLLPAMKTGQPWAIDLYVDTVCAIQEIGRDDLAGGDALDSGESIDDVLESAYRRFPTRTPLHEAAYRNLIETRPTTPPAAFSNGDLWPENLLVEDRRLTGVIDWQHAGWSDPVFEFLLPFFLVPELRGRGIEERYCRQKGYDPAILAWYHGVEFFDSLAWVLHLGKPYEMHTAETLTRDLESWLNTTQAGEA